MIIDLEKRTTEFAKNIVRLCKKLPNDCINVRLISQLMGSAGSIGANYREANDSLGDKDFLLRLRIARREAKEALHWLEIIKEANPDNLNEINININEVIELNKILSTIINKKSETINQSITAS
jgi:four helix bundle protein